MNKKGMRFVPVVRDAPPIDIRPLLRAHAEWIVHLREYVYGAGSLDPGVIVRDDQCALGHWIHGEASQYRHFPEYEAARQAHAVFHEEAAQVVRLMQAGRRHDAVVASSHGGRLQRQSSMMVRSFLQLSQRLQARRQEEADARAVVDDLGQQGG